MLFQVLPVSFVTSGDSDEDKRQTLFHRLSPAIPSVGKMNLLEQVDAIIPGVG